MGRGTEGKGAPRPRRVLLRILLGVVLALALGIAVYAGDYYRADESAAASLERTIPGVRVDAGRDRIVFVPDGAREGLIFYPGGKVEFSAYAPLMEELAREGILCVLVRMPLNLAVLDANAANGIPEAYPEIETWAVGGHSLGGAMAAVYAAGHPEEVDALVLLAAYSTADLSGSGVRVLSVYGTEDGVMKRDRYEEYRANLPADVTELIIDGGCHAGFGSYGPQKGDGTPLISREEQQRITAEAVRAFLTGRESASEYAA